MQSQARVLDIVDFLLLFICLEHETKNKIFVLYQNI